MYDTVYLSHHGVGHDDDPPGRGSGRYAWGSGANPYQHHFDLLSEVRRMRKNKMTQAEIAKALLGVKAYTKDGKEIWSTTDDLKAAISIAKSRTMEYNKAKIQQLMIECNGNRSEVARRMGLTDKGKPWTESTIRSYLDAEHGKIQKQYESTADFLRKKIEEVTPRPLDMSVYTEQYIGEGGVTDNVKKVAMAMLEKEGYVITKISLPTADPNRNVTVKVIGRKPKEGETELDVKREMQQHKLEMAAVTEFSPDQGQTFVTTKFPAPMDGNRIFIRYKEDGGADKDGVIELRRGVKDLSLGDAHYAQVRINVDGKAYAKGMAIYSDNIPPGYDMVINTNKKTGTDLYKVCKPFKVDIPLTKVAEKMGISTEELQKRIKKGDVFVDTTDDLKDIGFTEKQALSYISKTSPFGALIKANGQSEYEDSNGKKHLSLINKLREEGDWDTWSRTLSSQFLSKQRAELIKKQTDFSISDKKVELERLQNLTNPVIKKAMLEDFAKACDRTASDLSVRGFRNQKYQVLLPLKDIKNDEVYAPGFNDGDIVALVRYPHGAIFEIPILKVNNKNPEGRKVIGDNARDAIGINPYNAAVLSGADFDGDAAVVIPVKSNRIKIMNAPTPPELIVFDTKAYKLPDDAPRVKNSTKQIEMGKITNLMTDMQLAKDASISDIVRADKHSMVVIDSEKHHLDIKQSYIDNGIAELKKKYRNTSGGGAATIVSRSSAEVHIPKQKETVNRNIMTPEEQKDFDEGKRIFRPTGDTKWVYSPTKADPNRYLEKPVTQESTRMQFTSDGTRVDDAHTLVGDPNNIKEVIYADYANALKSIANQARKESRQIKATHVNREAQKVYKQEIVSLNEKIRIATSNQPRERMATSIASDISTAIYRDNPGMDWEHKQRVRARAMEEARAIVGAKKEPITLTDREWEAIQSGAITTNKITKIINNAKKEEIVKRATPKDVKITDNMKLHIKNLKQQGMRISDIAQSMGISQSYVSQILNAD